MVAVDSLADKLHPLGWSYGHCARYEGGELIWQVEAQRGEEKIIVDAPTLEAA